MIVAGLDSAICETQNGQGKKLVGRGSRTTDIFRKGAAHIPTPQVHRLKPRRAVASLSPRLFAAESRCKIMGTARQRLGTRAPWIPIRVGRCVTYSACRSLAPPRDHSPIRRFVPTACPSESLQAKRNRSEGNRPEKRHWRLQKPHK